MTLSAAYLRGQGPVAFNDPQGVMVAITGQLVTEKFVDVSTIAATGISVGHAGPNTTTSNMTIGGSLASGGVATLTPARAVTVTVTHATSIVAASGIVTGYDQFGNLVSEAWSVTATGTSKTSTTKKVFKKVTQITETAASDASANTHSAGDSAVIGLGYRAINQKLIAELQDTAVPGTAGTLVAGSSAATTDWRGTYTPNAVPDGAKDYTITYEYDPTEGQFKASAT